MCSTLSQQHTHISIPLLSAELLLTLTFVEDPGGHDVVIERLNYQYSQWFQFVEHLLTHGDQDCSNSLMLPAARPQQMLRDYCLTSLFLINSILQITSSVAEKLAYFKRLKELNIHRLFQLMHQLEHHEIDGEIDKYKSLEEEVIQKTNPEFPQLLNVSYGKFLTNIIHQTHQNPLEHCMHQLFETLSKTLVARTMSDNLKVLTLFHSVIDYLKEYSYGEENINIDSVVNISLNHLVDGLQSDEIAKRAMSELELAQKEIENLESEIRALRKDKEITKGGVLSELRQTQQALAEKETAIEKLEKELKRCNDQRKHEKRRFDQTVSHKLTNIPRRANTLSVFDHLKSQTDRSSNKGITRDKSCLLYTSRCV